MSRQHNGISAALAAFTLISATSSAHASDYSDDLGKCMVTSTSEEDRNAMIRWMFTAVASNPAVKDIVTVSPAQVDKANAAMGALMIKLLTESCHDKTVAALQYEGLAAIQHSFEVLGQVAGREMFSTPGVAASFAGLQKYLDNDKLKKLVASAAEAQMKGTP
jgi:hypothetical protein